MDQHSWTVAELLQLSGGYWGACALHAGVELDVFTPLAAGAKDAAEVAGELSCDPRGLTMLLDALASMGLLMKREGRYVVTPFSAEYLVRASDKYLGHIIRHHHHLVAGWARLDEAVRSGRPVREPVSHGEEAQERESFLMGMFNLAMQIAPRIAPLIDLSGHRRLLDLGGGPGTYAIHFCMQNPELSAVVYDLPTTREFADATVARFLLSDRVGFAAGDFLTDAVPTGFDVVWVSHVLHSCGPEECALLLAKGVEALEPGGILLVQEFILDDTRDGPLFPALFSLNMLLGTPTGQAYSGRELSALMSAAGLCNVQRIPLQLPNGAGVMIGTKPAARPAAS
jgi:SAM-dependent methyltransferase